VTACGNAASTSKSERVTVYDGRRKVRKAVEMVFAQFFVRGVELILPFEEVPQCLERPHPIRDDLLDR
jgi:hypothetical protein